VLGYLTLARDLDARAEVEAKRSRFIAVLRRVDDEPGARDLLAEQRKAHHSARHHCSAFAIGPSPAHERSSDDGEPAGTAGVPMLEVLRGQGLSDVAAVVTRYFGGTLLGAGGLVRAYSDAVSEALDQATFVRRQRLQLHRLEVPLALVGKVEGGLRDHGLLVRDVDYPATGEHASILLAGDDVQRIGDVAASLTSAVPRLEAAGEEWIDVPTAP
jgi:uncharacterized YigZ family protein